MNNKIAIGGGSGAVVTSAHAGCERFRGTDPLITGQTRRNLAKALGAKDTVGSISEARWTRAKTFETLVHDPEFAGRIVSTALGGAGLPKPENVQVFKAGEDSAVTLDFLEKAIKAAKKGTATLIQAPAVPPPGFTSSESSLVLPDFIIVTANPVDASKFWLIIGDAKDYERNRSKIDDARMLKGFIQVAFGAYAFQEWLDLPEGLEVHTVGALAVPRNSFLQPTIVTETLTDHIQEVQLRYQQRLDDAQTHSWTGEAASFVSHLKATFDPGTCRSCSLFDQCRGELRRSTNPDDFLQEIGVPKSIRPLAISVVEGVDGFPERVPSDVVAHINATLTGHAVLTGRKRTDPVGTPGTINVVIAKSDNAALGVYGIGIQNVTADGPSAWTNTVLDVPESNETRRQIAQLLGEAILKSRDSKNFADEPSRINIIVPDKQTGDILASIADVLAGNEISRLRWERDIDMDREPVTFDGSPANIPLEISPEQRLGISFLLEDDRARAFKTRVTNINLLSVLTELFISGGPAAPTGRLDYTVRWGESIHGEPVDYKELLESIESSPRTPGAHLSQIMSDQIHDAYMAKKSGVADSSKYQELVLKEIEFKESIFDSATAVLATFKDSTLRQSLLTMEADAQKIWHRRWRLQAYDLVRFGLTSRWWRNSLVDVVDGDQKCIAQLNAVLNPMAAEAQAKAAGNRDLSMAEVISVEPLTLSVASRRFKSETKVFVLHVNGVSEVETRAVTVNGSLKGHIKVTGMVRGVLSKHDSPVARQFVFDTTDAHDFEVGDKLVLAADDWLGDGTKGSNLKIDKPKFDAQQAPKDDCDESSYAESPEEHKYCCRPHTSNEAEVSDKNAAKREAGEMNPQMWPPVIDVEAFDQLSPNDPTDQTAVVEITEIPDGLTEDDLD